MKAAFFFWLTLHSLVDGSDGDDGHCRKVEPASLNFGVLGLTSGDFHAEPIIGELREGRKVHFYRA